MNKLCISKLVQFIDTENVPTAFEDRKPVAEEEEEERGGSRSVSRVLSATHEGGEMIISLGNRLLDSSSSLPGSRWRAGPTRWEPWRQCRQASAHAPCLTLLPVGFTEPSRSPGLLVSSYLTVSPLPHGPKSARRFAFCCTFPGLSAGGRYPSLRPAEPGLSSRRVLSEPTAAAPFRPGRRSSDRLPTADQT